MSAQVNVKLLQGNMFRLGYKHGGMEKQCSIVPACTFFQNINGIL